MTSYQVENHSRATESCLLPHTSFNMRPQGEPVTGHTGAGKRVQDRGPPGPLGHTYAEMGTSEQPADSLLSVSHS